MIPLDMQAKITEWRQKALSNELTLDEMKEAIKYLRAGRAAAIATSATATKKKAKAEIPHADDLLAELDGL